MKTISEKKDLIQFLNKYNLLYSKITPHDHAPNNVPRLHCLKRLSGYHWQTALIVAPAGFGKSNLLRQYVSSQKQSCCWISVSADENDINRFVHYLMAAIKSVDSSFDKFDTLIKGLIESLEKFKTNFINELALMDSPLIIVLEDFHNIDNPQVKDLVKHIITCLPENIKFMLSSRNPVILNIAKYRLERKIIEVNSADLRFNRNEIEFMFIKYNSICDVNIKKVEKITGGWPAALQLVYMSEKSEMSQKNNLKNLNKKHIKDYIREEILEYYPENVKDFLLKSSILSSLTPSLCKAITGFTNASEILEDLQKSNTFITLLNDNEQWFRFHPVFGGVLSDEFINHYSEQNRSIIHKKASIWYEKNAYLQEALDHAINSNDYTFIDEFLDRNVEGKILLGQLNQLVQWFGKLEEKKIASPIAKIWIAWLKLFSLDIDHRALDYLIGCADHAYKNLSNNNDAHSSIPVHIKAIQSFIATFDENYHTGIQLSIDALSMLRTIGIVNKSLESSVKFNLARSHFPLGNFTQTTYYARESEKLGFSIGNYYGAIASVNLRAQVMIQLLDIDGAEKLYLESLKFLLENNLADQPFSAYLYNGLGEIEYLRNEFGKATIFLQKAVGLSSRGKEIESLVNGHILLAKIYLEQKNKRRLYFHIRKLDDLILKVSAKNCLREVRAFKDYVNLIEKNISHRELIKATNDYCHIDNFTDIKEYEMFIYANELMIKKQPEDALSLISHHLALAEKLDRKMSLLRFRFIESRALAQLGRKSEFIKSLIAALQISISSGVEIFFVQAKKWLPLNLSENITSAMALAILQSMGNQESDVLDQSDLYKSALTKRELEVMGKLKEGLSNKQIAGNMRISEGTVKRHMHNIFSKLNVKNRVAAIQC